MNSSAPITSLLLAADDSARVFYQLGRLQSLTEWWHWLLLVAVVLMVTTYVSWMYRRDGVELPRAMSLLLLLLRVSALAGVLFFFLQLEKRTERKLVKPSRAMVMVDTSQSMGLRDALPGSTAGPSRSEIVAEELKSGGLVEQLREKHEVTVLRFDDAEMPVEITTFPRKPTPEETAASAIELSAEDRLAAARQLALVAAVLLGIAAILALVAWFGKLPVAAGETSSWAALVAGVLLITGLVVLATANLRSEGVGPLAILGLAPPASSADDAPTESDEKPAEAVIDWQEAVAPRGGETRIGDNLQAIIDRERGGSLAGVVLVTDGGQNAGQDVASALVSAQDALLPVITIGMGSDKRSMNLRVVDLEAPERVYPGDKFTLTGYVQAINYAKTSVTVELVSVPDGGTTETREDERVIDVGSRGEVIPVAFELTPEEQGIREYKLRIKPVAGEVEARDNEKTAKVEIIDRKTKVLLVAGGPTREFIFLRNQLFRDRETTVDVLLQSARPGLSQDANEILEKFPTTEEELFAYDSIVAFDADWDELEEDQVRLLERWVAEKAGGLIVVAGPVFTPQWSSRRRGDIKIDTIKSLYPVAFFYQGSATLSLGRFGSEEAWPLTFTRDGEEAEFLWLGENSNISAWNEFEGVYGYYAVKDPKPGARVFARFSDPETAIDGELPIYMAGHFYGSGRVFYMASGEMWRVRAVDDVYFEQFYTKLIRWASAGRLLRNSSRGVLLVDKDRCVLGEDIIVRAILQDAQFQPLVQAKVDAVLVSPSGARTVLPLNQVKDAAREGMYSEQFTAEEEGDYRVELQNPSAGDELLVQEVRVRIPALETEQPQRNDALLKEIADKTGGQYFIGLESAVGVDDATGVHALLRPQDQVTVLPGTPDRQFDRQLMTWLLTFIATVLSLEWLIRRLSRLA
ncbi:hypothetical protein Psta_3225 [Pirellula staleyi DSM 6068]|uniref:VWFA domain-containing protein n=1 Tax=Pirellula staleyi (strain ATCC 27377 / DSM 6068 / ICPB 4128) TaxID=530564 RepID=D2QX49_PIRSD|nr:vWA domain-containing protein [Pirellula staleyi]ADB17889.1 hypothetical protein Psta_3225 [Pirellula staleyi DSM 6068]